MLPTTGLHSTPSLEYAILFVVPLPTAIHCVPPHATPSPKSVKILLLLVDPVHTIPSLEYAIVLVVPSPTATQSVSFHATPRPFEKIFLLDPTRPEESVAPVQVSPSLE